MSDTTLLVPRFDHPAIEERYAAAQSRLLLARSAGAAPIVEYALDEPARSIAARVTTPYCIAITDPLIVIGHDLAPKLIRAVQSGAGIAIPAANESANPLQQRPAALAYLTAHQFEEAAALTARFPHGKADASPWDDSNPAVFACMTSLLSSSDAPLQRFVHGRMVVVAPGAFIHRFTPHRGQTRPDLLDRIPRDARSILEFGCGEGALGASVKARQECRYVGLELDEDAATLARTRLDTVHSGDARTILGALDERFDLFIGGDIVEHLDDPWSFLASLRRIAAPGAQLLLSLPNIGAWPIVRDLLHGRFDYVYLGLLCAGHVRHFTRQTIEDMLAISGWSPLSIERQPAFATPEGLEFIAALERGGMAVDREDLLTPGFYVTATCFGVLSDTHR
ncbi:MAG: class I SAM-dependent methyltransferase [Thermoanaerobaculia bacterium]